MGGWGEYGLAMGLFIASHFLPRIGGLRERLIGAVGRRMYFSVYGMVSLLLLAWVILAAGRAPYVELWAQMPWMRWLPNLAMPLAGLLAICGAGVNNPWTLGGRGDAESATSDAPGFAALSRHPLLIALGLWAAAHGVVNGDLAHLTLFGAFAALAFGAIPLFDRRAARALGKQAPAFFARTAILSPAPLANRRWWRAIGRRMAIRATIALIVWLGLLHLHAPVIGVSPFP